MSTLEITQRGIIETKLYNHFIRNSEFDSMGYDEFLNSLCAHVERNHIKPRVVIYSLTFDSDAQKTAFCLKWG